MKTMLSLVFLLITVFSDAPELSQLRADYPKANENAAIANSLFQQLVSITKADGEILTAYKGAVLTLKAKYAKGIKKKKEYFKEGAELLEYAIAEQPKNIEIRCLRLSVQENAPKITGYKKNISEDKQYILDHYKSISNKEIKKFVKGYVLQSDAFDESERQLF